MREHPFLRDISADPAFLSGLRALRALSADSGFDVVLTMPDGSMHRPSGAGPARSVPGQVIASSENSAFFRRADVLYAPDPGGDDAAPADDLALLTRAIDFLTELERLSAAFFSGPGTDSGTGNIFYNSTGADALSNAV